MARSMVTYGTSYAMQVAKKLGKNKIQDIEGDFTKTM